MRSITHVVGKFSFAARYYIKKKEIISSAHYASVQRSFASAVIGMQFLVLIFTHTIACYVWEYLMIIISRFKKKIGRAARILVMHAAAFSVEVEVLLTSALNTRLSTFEPVYRRLPQFFAIKHTLCQNTEYRITGGHNFRKLSATFADD